MFCPKCGTENPDDASFCGNCGEDLSVYSVHSDSTNGKKKPNFKLIIGLIGSCLLLALVFLFISSNTDLELPYIGRLRLDFMRIDLSGIDLPDWLPIQEQLQKIGPGEQDDSEVKITQEEEEETAETVDEAKSAEETITDELDSDEGEPFDVVSSEDETPGAKPQIDTPQPPPGDEISETEPPGRIVFTCQVDQQANHDQICIMNADGSGWKQLTDDIKYEHYYSSPSKDGSEIVFSSSLPDRKGFNIFIMDSDGSNLRQITSGMGNFYAPALSPDGQHIAATQDVGSKNYITLLTRDGVFVKNLNSYHDCKDPVWSPDGSEILFAANPDKTEIQFYVMNSDGSNIRKLTDIDGLRGRCDWSVDGSMASYTGELSQHNRELFLFGKDQSPVIITDGGDNLAPSFSPDGKWITFMSYRDNFWDSDGCEIYVMRLKDGYTKRLTNNDYCDYQPRWGK